MNAATALQIVNAIATIAEHSDKVLELLAWLRAGCPDEIKPALVRELPAESAAAAALRKRLG